MPVTEITPVVATVLKSICPPLTDRLASFVVPPTAPPRFTEPVPPVTVRARAPLIVELNEMFPAPVPLLTVTAALWSRSTGPVKVMLPPWVV